MYFVYILKSVNFSKSYVGLTDNVNRRLGEHNLGKSYYTKRYLPWILQYSEECLNRERAIKREKQLKTGFGRKYIKQRI